MDTKNLREVASQFQCHPLSRGIHDCEYAGELMDGASDEIDRLRELIEEQKGTIKALNIALGGKDSTSTENLIDAHDLDCGDQGLISVIRNQNLPHDQLNVNKEDHPCIADCIVWSESELAWIRSYGRRCFNYGNAQGLSAGQKLFDCFPQAHRLALELECLLMSCTDTAATAKWWESANEALEQWREFCADDQPHISPLGVD